MTAMPLPVRAIVPNSLARHAPQRIIRVADICDECGAINSFLNRVTIRGIIYARCKHCGRSATVTIVVKKPSPPASR